MKIEELLEVPRGGLLKYEYQENPVIFQYVLPGAVCISAEFESEPANFTGRLIDDLSPIPITAERLRDWFDAEQMLSHIPLYSIKTFVGTVDLRLRDGEWFVSWNNTRICSYEFIHEIQALLKGLKLPYKVDIAKMKGGEA